MDLGSRAQRAFYRVAWSALWLPCRALWRVEMVNRPDLRSRKGGLLVASNHQSFADPVLVGLGCGQPIHYLARRDLFAVPVLGPVLRGISVHPVTRDATDMEAIRTVLRLLRAGEVVLMFPEGTRTHDGALGPFKAGVAALAIRSGVPVLPACVEGAFECWPRTQRLPRSGRVDVAFGRAIRPDGADADELTARVRDEIGELQRSLRERRGSGQGAQS